MAPHPQEKSSIGKEILAVLCRDTSLFDFLPEEEKKEMETIAEHLKSSGRLDQPEEFAKLRKLGRLRDFSPLDEIHPGWLLEKLEGESPRVIGIFCRFLAGETTRDLIQSLPPRLKQKLPKLSETYRVSPQIVEIVRDCVERKFAVSVPPLSGTAFSFSHIVWMKCEDLRKLFYDLGLEEIRKAFFRVESQLLRTFLSRFSAEEAKEIRGRIETGGEVPPDKKKEAQRAILTLSLAEEGLSSEGLIREIGYARFAKSISGEEKAWSDLVCQKLSPEEGMRLRRRIQEGLVRRKEAGMDDRKEEILRRVFFLSQKRLIRSYWKERSKS